MTRIGDLTPWPPFYVAMIAAGTGMTASGVTADHGILGGLVVTALNVGGIGAVAIIRARIESRTTLDGEYP